MARGLGCIYMFHGHTKHGLSISDPRSEDLYKVQGRKGSCVHGPLPMKGTHVHRELDLTLRPKTYSAPGSEVHKTDYKLLLSS